jgi:hypothetical protein
MKTTEQFKKIRFDDVPEVLVELSRKTIRSRGLVVFHLENSLLNFLLRIRGIKYIVFLHGNLGDVICSRLIQGEVTFF